MSAAEHPPLIFIMTGWKRFASNDSLPYLVVCPPCGWPSYAVLYATWFCTICKMFTTLLNRFRASENIFEPNLKYLFYVGLWVDENLSENNAFLYKIYQITLHCFSVIFFVITGIKTYQIKSDITLFLANIDKSIVAYKFFMQVIIFVLRREELQKLVDDIFFHSDKITEKSRNKMINHLILITLLMSTVMMIFSMLGLYTGDMTMEAWMPFDAKKNVKNLALSAQILAVLFVIPFLYRAIGMQGIVCSLIIYLCEQLVNLQVEIRNLEYSKENERENRDKLKQIVKKHIRLMRYSNAMEKIFKEYFLVQNLGVTMELCLNAVMVTVVGSEQRLLIAGFLAFLGLALLNAYIYCSLGNQLMDESKGIAFAAYECDWTSWPVDLQKDVLLIIRAAQTPFQMSAGGVAVVSIQTFGTALYNGYSIFAVLSDVVEN